MISFFKKLTGALAAGTLLLSPSLSYAQKSQAPVQYTLSAEEKDVDPETPGEEIILSTDVNNDAKPERITLNKSLDTLVRAEGLALKNRGKTPHDRFYIFIDPQQNLYILQYPHAATIINFEVALSRLDQQDPVFGDGSELYRYYTTTDMVEPETPPLDQKEYLQYKKDIVPVRSAKKTTIQVKRQEAPKPKLTVTAPVTTSSISIFTPFPITLALYDVDPRFPLEELIVTSDLDKDGKREEIILSRDLSQIANLEGYDQEKPLDFSDVVRYEYDEKTGAIKNQVPERTFIALQKGGKPFILQIRQEKDNLHYAAALAPFVEEAGVSYTSNGQRLFQLVQTKDGWELTEEVLAIDPKERAARESQVQRYTPKLTQYTLVPPPPPRLTFGDCTIYSHRDLTPADRKKLAAFVQELTQPLRADTQPNPATGYPSTGNIGLLLKLTPDGKPFDPTNLDRSVPLLYNTTGDDDLAQKTRDVYAQADWKKALPRFKTTHPKTDVFCAAVDLEYLVILGP